MADTKISALAAASAVVAANELAINEAGTSKKVTADQIKAFIYDRYLIRCNTTHTLDSSTNVQTLFESPTNGRLTLPSGVYLFDGMFLITGMSGTSGSALIDILGAGTATITSWLWRILGMDISTPTTSNTDDDSIYRVTNASTASAHGAQTGTAMRTHIKGTFDVTTGGTIIPSIDLVTAAAAVVAVGSYFQCERIGATGLSSSGPWD